MHEQVAEPRMFRVRGRQGQDDLGVACQVDGPAPAATVGDRDPAQLDVILGRNRDLGMGVEVVLPAAELRPRFREDRLVAVRSLERRLKGGRPEPPAGCVAQIAERAPMVAGAVFAPAHDGHVLPAAVATAGVGDHDVIPAVRQELHFGSKGLRSVEHPHRCLKAAGGGLRLRKLRGVHIGRDRLGDPLLQEQHCGLEGRVRLKALLHRPVQQHICQREQAHALVMGHEGPDHGADLPARQAGRRVVDRLVETEVALTPLGRESLQIFTRLRGRYHQGQCRGIGCHHQILGEPALQPQAGHAERPVLVIEMSVHAVVAGFRHAPRYPALGSVVDLPLHRGPAGLVQQRAVVGRHNQQGHQVLEHRSAPGEQHRFAAGAGEPASHGKPALLRQLPLRDGHEGRQPGLGGQQVIVAGVAPAVVQEKVVLHARKLVGVKRKPLHDGDSLLGALATLGDQPLQFGPPVCVRGARPEPRFDGWEESRRDPSQLA